MLFSHYNQCNKQTVRSLSLISDVTREQGITTMDVWMGILKNADDTRGHLVDRLGKGEITEEEFGHLISKHCSESVSTDNMAMCTFLLYALLSFKFLGEVTVKKV